MSDAEVTITFVVVRPCRVCGLDCGLVHPLAEWERAGLRARLIEAFPEAQVDVDKFLAKLAEG